MAMYPNSIYESIYQDVFCHTFSESCFVFLCGGADKDSIRDKVRRLLDDKRFQILYPEDLFMEMLNRNRSSDLLEYENLLAENADIICIICESMGSAVELGAFVQSENVKSKLVVVINSKYRRDKSFIMMGPVKHIKKSYPDRLTYYKSPDVNGLVDDLKRCFRKLHKKVFGSRNNSLQELSAYIAFIPQLIYFFQKIGRDELYKGLKQFLTGRDILPARYKEFFNIAINYLMKTGIVVSGLNQREMTATLSLSPKGYLETKKVLDYSSASEKTILHDRIRCDILKEQLNNSRSF